MARLDHPLDPLLRKLQQHSALDEADRQAILDLPHAPRRLEAQAFAVREGDTPATCGVLVSGFAYRQKLTGAGSRQILSLHLPGDPLDLQHLFLDEADHSIQMLTRAELAVIPREALQELARSRPAIGQALFATILVEASIFREWVLNVGRRDSRARIAHMLCEFAVRLEANGLADVSEYQLPMTQQQLADALGLTPVHVNRTLKVLERDGLIVRNKRNVAFPNWKRMIEVADFNRRYLHIKRQEVGALAT